MSSDRNLSSLILAAGEGTRMKSDIPKILHKVCGKEMINWVIDTVEELGVAQNIIVLGHGKEQVMEALQGVKADFAYQMERKGTGHAARIGGEKLSGGEDHIIVLYGDSPMIQKETLEDFISYHEKEENDITVLTAKVGNSKGYGRIVRSGDGEFLRIVEENDATPEEKKIKEINSGIYLFRNKGKMPFMTLLGQIKNENKKGEYYLTDAIEIIKSAGGKVGAYEIEDETEILAANNRVELSVLNRIMRKRINEGHMLNGVTMIDPDAVYIEKGVSIGKDTILYPGTFLEGDTVIGAGCEIGPNVKIKDSTLGEGIKIENAGVDSVVIKDHVTIGPYVYLRPGTVLEEKVKVGRFVELKNTKVASGSKVPHLSYVGDAEIGKGVNIGAGVITVNYDGKNKHKTIIGDDAFIGCNANLIAPIKIGDGAYVAAGSTITDDVEEKSLAIARERQTNKKDWINKYK